MRKGHPPGQGPGLPEGKRDPDPGGGRQEEPTENAPREDGDDEERWASIHLGPVSKRERDGIRFP